MTTHTTHATTDSIASFLGSVSLAPRQAQKSLTLWPMLRGSAPSMAPEYITLSEAFARGHLAIDELRKGATVPHVLATNRGEVAVLVLFGEEIRGAKQNRIANASFLVPPHKEVVLDVSCVEHGRWSHRPSGGFASTGAVMSSDVRRKMNSRVSISRRAGHGFDADQGEVWDEIGARVRHSRTESASGAYADYLSTRRRDLDEMAAAFRPVPGQVGFVACIGEEVAGLEGIGRPEVFAQAFPGLLRGYLIDAIDHSLVRGRRAAVGPAARFDGPEPFLAALAEARVEMSPSLGLGTDLRIEDGRVSACALVAGEVVHLTAFPAAG
jgi:hypothetical protein